MREAVYNLYIGSTETNASEEATQGEEMEPTERCGIWTSEGNCKFIGQISRKGNLVEVK